jgi:hypothetical protein
VPVGKHFVTLYTSDGRAYLSKGVTVQKNKTASSHWKLGG